MKEETNEQRNHLSDKTKELENIKYKRDAFVKKIKDNLEAFVHRN